MELYEALTSWGIFAVVVSAGIFYYWPAQQRRAERRRDDAQNAGRRRRNEQETRQRPTERPSSNDQAQSTATAASEPVATETTRKRKAPGKDPVRPTATPAVVVQDEQPEEVDMSTKQWAQQMLQARQGVDMSSKNTKESRVKTVKQSSALGTPNISSGSSQAGAEADDDLSPAASPSLQAGDVSDMLEPVPSGPTSLRITASNKPQKEKAIRQPKEEVVETKKQRQNRQKVEERKLEREAEEKQRKTLEEKQRRAAREARGEPAKNGIPAPKPPSSAWKASSSAPAVSAPTANGTHDTPLLDTFDAESTGSSNGGLATSTAATSTTSAGGYDGQSEEEQMAQAMKQSEDDSGWTTAVTKKGKNKKAGNGEAAVAEPVLSNKTNAQTARPTSNGKPKGFQALDVEYEQRTDADPNDASNWDA